jgi:hypothetical protein
VAGAGAGSGVLARSGRPARPLRRSHGDGDGQLVEHLASVAPADPGRQAGLVGGGAEVAYDPPR